MGEKIESIQDDITARFVGDKIVPIVKGGMTDTAVNQLGGRINKAEDPEEIENDEILEDIRKQNNSEGVIKENMSGKDVLITENGSQIDQDTGDVILEGSND